MLKSCYLNISKFLKISKTAVTFLAKWQKNAQKTWFPVYKMAIKKAKSLLFWQPDIIITWPKNFFGRVLFSSACMCLYVCLCVFGWVFTSRFSKSSWPILMKLGWMIYSTNISFPFENETNRSIIPEVRDNFVFIILSSIYYYIWGRWIEIREVIVEKSCLPLFRVLLPLDYKILNLEKYITKLFKK